MGLRSSLILTSAKQVSLGPSAEQRQPSWVSLRSADVVPSLIPIDKHLLSTSYVPGAGRVPRELAETRPFSPWSF